MKHFDYIFTGTGLAALMTVSGMLHSKKFENATILLLDENSKKTNDRTWCFWDKEALYENLVSKKWNNALFLNGNYSRILDLNPYSYKKIKGLDFYKSVFETIEKHKNCTFLQEKVIDLNEEAGICYVTTETEQYSCSKVINSIYNPNIPTNQIVYPVLQQHFIGWFITTKEPVFTEKCATFMDFSVPQKGNTRFMYVLPTAANEALIEYTLFSKNLLSKEEYELEIIDYIHKLGISEYEIVEKEQGSIPMTCFPFWKQNTKNCIHIGSAGGWTKASTGFTFKNTTKKAKKLVDFLSTTSDFRKFHKKDKFWFYDLLLLDILSAKNELGVTIFSALFRKGEANLVFKFLDEETTFFQDLQVIWKCPKRIFIKALFNRIRKLV